MGNKNEAIKTSDIKIKNAEPFSKKQCIYAGICFTICFIIGLKLPDIDLALPFLLHRSIITHSILVPMLFIMVALCLSGKWIDKLNGWFFVMMIAGMYLGVAIHLSFDLFPASWRGYALISIPIYGRTSPLFSWVWISANIAFCLFFSLQRINNLSRITNYQYKTLASLCFIGGFSYSAVSEPDISIKALIFLLIIGSIIMFILSKTIKQAGNKTYNNEME